MYTGDPGGAGKGLIGGRMMVPRGKMLGGSSGLNYMAYVRGHPGDFDAWAAGGAEGWSYDEVLPYFPKSRGLRAAGPAGRHARPRRARHRRPAGGVGALSRSSRASSSSSRPRAAGIPSRVTTTVATASAPGVASLFQTTTKDGRRSSTFHAYLEPAMDRENLTVVTGALVERVLLEADGEVVLAPPGSPTAPRTARTEEVAAGTEVVVCAGAIGSPQLLLLSGVGARDELAAVGVDCVVDLPHVGQAPQGPPARALGLRRPPASA